MLEMFDSSFKVIAVGGSGAGSEFKKIRDLRVSDSFSFYDTVSSPVFRVISRTVIDDVITLKLISSDEVSRTTSSEHAAGATINTINVFTITAQSQARAAANRRAASLTVTQSV